MKTTDVLLQMTHLNKTFTSGGVDAPALKEINLTINRGDYVSIQGPSGGGKSTLLSIIGLLDQPSGGDYQISGMSVTDLTPAQMAQVRNREIGFIFQDFNLIGDMTVSENVALPLIYRGVGRDERNQRVAEVLGRVNMTARADHLPTQLSGGQQQRVAVARALVGSPSLLLADEPTGNLDSINGDSVMQLLSELNEQGTTICMVTHDSRYADYAKRVVHLFDGQIQGVSTPAGTAEVTPLNAIEPQNLNEGPAQTQTQAQATSGAV